MPIPRNLFDEGIDEIDRALLDFLKASPDQAYSTIELAEATDIDMDYLPSRASFIERLGVLQEQGKITGKVINRVWYYSLP